VEVPIVASHDWEATVLDHTYDDVSLSHFICIKIINGA
jgi:hypothetical protein